MGKIIFSLSGKLLFPFVVKKTPKYIERSLQIKGIVLQIQNTFETDDAKVSTLLIWRTDFHDHV